MRKLLIPLLASLLLPTAVYALWGKYNSKIEAEKACNEWERNGISYTLLYLNDKPLNTNNRWCRHEAETRQYLGYQHTIGVKRDRNYTEEEYKNLKEKGYKQVIKKYFRY